MSTRAVVKIINGKKSMELYHHCDGYPEGLGCFLLKEMKKVQDEYLTLFPDLKGKYSSHICESADGVRL